MTHPVRAMQVLPVLSVISVEVCGTSGSARTPSRPTGGGPGAGDGWL